MGTKVPPPHTHINNEKISHPVALVDQNVSHQLSTKINSEVRYITVINYTCLIKKVRAKGKGEDKKVLPAEEALDEAHVDTPGTQRPVSWKAGHRFL